MERSREHIDSSKGIHKREDGVPQCYFITLGTWNEECLFGSVYRDKIILNDFGETVRMEWCRLFETAEDIRSDEFVVMPNHVHGIIILTGEKDEQRGTGASPCTSDFVRKFEETVVKQISHRNGITRNKIWQEDYHERVIHTRSELEYIREYIRSNPRNWWQDELRPQIYTDMYG